ncbi:hypothetical protein ABW19_dt0206236 [Dactylella cylindrospora]|nr:hypothetical protein ABW19_dt0206236 [Dactylella cylindrospora]
MKDLYTFDHSMESALSTYNDVTGAYKSFFDELSLPYLLSEADSGAMGGNLSHEYHYPCETGEDIVVSCSTDDGCGYTANLECVDDLPVKYGKWVVKDTKVWYGVSKDRRVLIKAYYPGSARLATSENEEWIKREINPRAIQKLVGDEGGGLEVGMEEASALNAWEQEFKAWEDTLDSTTGQITEGEQFSRILKIYDGHLLDGDGDSKFSTFSDHEEDFSAESPSMIKQFYANKKIPSIVKTSTNDKEGSKIPIFLCKPRTGDTCPKCKDGELSAVKTTELGHTFYLGTRYSEPLKAQVGFVDDKGVQSRVNMQMGCYGIGVTRLIAAIAEAMRDEKGLCWPKAVAPYSVVVVYTSKKGEEGDVLKDGAEEVYDEIVEENRWLEDDIVLDDREESVARKMKEADLIGYSVIVVVGKSFHEERLIEVQERRTGVKHMVKMEDLKEALERILG